MASSTNNDFLTSVQQLMNSHGKSVNFADLPIAQNPQVAALASKLVKQKEESRTHAADETANMNFVFPGTDQISRQIMGRIEDSDNAFKLFPDLGLVAQTVVSSILSPKDMLKSELNFRFEDSRFSPDLTNKILEVVKKEITQTHRIEERLYEIVMDALFRGGSHPVMVLPEAAVDHVINRHEVITTESIRETGLFTKQDIETVEHLGILGDPRDTVATNISAMETMFGKGTKSAAYNENVFVKDTDSQRKDEDINIRAMLDMMQDKVKVTDNLQIFKLPELIEKSIKQRVASATGNKLFAMALESTSRTDPARLYGMLYKNAPGAYVPYTTIPSSMNLKRRSVGRPLVLHPSAAAVIPAYVPGDYSVHIGYFVAIDADGNTVAEDSTLNEFGQSLTNMGSNDRSGAATSPLLTDRAKQNIMSDNYTPRVDRMAEIYAEILEKDLMERLAKGIYHGKEISISRNTELARIMLARAWKNRYTRLVYVPAEYVTYFAFNYHKNGTGRSYMDDLSNVISMRAMVLFARIWAKVRSSISVIKTHISFDQRDTDPVKSIETVKHLIAKSRQQYFPNGLRSVQDFTDWIHKAGIMITWDNHPRLPNTKIESEATNVEHVEPDSELDEMLRHMCYMHCGVSPETIDGAGQAEFATTVQTNNILFARRNAMLAAKLSTHATDLTAKIAFNDECIQQQIVELLNQNSEEIIKDLDDEERVYFEENKARFTQTLVIDTLNRIRVSLPESESTATVNLKNELENYEQLLDKVLESVLSSDVLPVEVGGNLNGKMDALKGVWKAHLMRQFMADNNITPEAFKIASVDEDGGAMVNLNEIIQAHSRNVMLAVTDLMKRMKPLREAGDRDLEVLDAEGGGSADYGNDSGSEDSSAGGEDDGFGFSDGSGDEGGDPFADDQGGGTDDTAAADTDANTPEEEATEAPTDAPEEKE